MHPLSTDDSRAWAAAHGFQINASFGHPIPSDVPTAVKFAIPIDAGRRVALARTLWEASGAGSTALVWVTAWGIWPSGELVPLAEAARSGLGVQAPLAHAPGHLASAGDDAGLVVFTLAILFLWDCWILPEGTRPAVFISHDEFGLVDTRHGDSGLTDRLTAMDLVR